MLCEQVTRRLAALLLVVVFGLRASHACELCAVYNASNARSEFTQGLVFAAAEQFTHFGTEQLDGKEVVRPDPDRLDSSITHWVLGYNMSPRVGLSFSLPMIYRSFRRSDLRFSLTEPPAPYTEGGSNLDLGDVALLGRWTALAKRTMQYDVLLNALAGVKFPTGDTDRLKDEVQQSQIFNALLPPGTPHDPLAHSTSSVHQHDLSPGSGSFDGIFGLTLNTRWKRWLFNAQFQYALRSEGEATFQYGDDLLITCGPGRYLLADEHFTLSLQAIAVYESLARDRLLDTTSDRTGSTGWYFGPLINLTWGGHFAANAGVDVPLSITANGFQAVPDYRVHAGVSWRY
jgi:hypothetical protein